MFLLSLILSTAFAKDPEITQPSVGASMMTVDGCKRTLLASPWNTRNAGQMVIDDARAYAICLEADGNLALATAKAQAMLIRAPAEAQLIRDSGMAVATGKDVKVIVTDERLTVESGQHLQWQAYGQALATNPGALGVGGVYDPRFVQPFALDQGRAGFMAHPAVPGGGMAAPASAPAKCGTAQECQKAIDQLQALAAADAEK